MRFPIKATKIKEIARQFQKIFEKEEIERQARLHGFVQKESKLQGFVFATLCIEGVSKEGQAVSLEQLCTLAMNAGVELVKQSLDERFNEQAVHFMEGLFRRVLDYSLGHGVSLRFLSQFNGVFLEDATLYQLPQTLKGLFKGSGGGASQAGIKIDCTVDLQAGSWKVQFRDAATNDGSMDLLMVPKRSLWLRDLGYFKVADFQRIKEQSAYFVSRLRTNVNVYASKEADAEALDLLKWNSQMKENEIRERQVYLGVKDRLPVRLIVQKVPKKVANKKRHKLRTDKQNKRKSLSKRRLKFCDLNIYITNLEGKEWSARKVIGLYRIRWQIELLFKVWKSTLKINVVRKVKETRFMCLLYGQMIWALLYTKLFQCFQVIFWNDHQKQLSIQKGVKILKCAESQLIEGIFRGNSKKLLVFLKLSYQALGAFAQKDPKKSNENELFYMC